MGLHLVTVYGSRFTAFLALAVAGLCCIICGRGQRQDERSPTPPAASRCLRARRLTADFRASVLPACGKNLEAERLRRSPPPPRATPRRGTALGSFELSPPAPVS